MALLDLDAYIAARKAAYAAYEDQKKMGKNGFDQHRHGRLLLF